MMMAELPSGLYIRVRQTRSRIVLQTQIVPSTEGTSVVTRS